MGKKTKTGKGRLDKFYHLAKEQGFRARSAFKLTQLAKQFNLFDRASVCVDLCGAPGGWSQVAVQAMPRGSKVICVDLVPIKPIKGVVTIQSDITTQTCRNLIKSELDGKSHVCDLVLNDGAPNVGSAWSKDAYNQSELTLYAFQLACDLLRPGGTFVTKVFRSADYNSLLWTFQQLFTKVESTKPSASRAVSAEIFVVCHGFKAPSKIDPKFFNPKFVFMNEIGDMQEGDDEETAAMMKKAASLTTPDKPTSLSGLLKSIGKRNRGGYAEGDDFRTVTVDDFLTSANPAELLIKCHKILVNPATSSVTVTEPMLSYFADLKVLGKGELYAIMKWRQKKINGLKKQKRGDKLGDEEDSKLTSEEGVDNMEDDQDSSSSSESTKSDSLMSLARSQMAAERREQKKLRAKEKKASMRKKMSMNISGIAEATSASFEQDLFHLPNIREKSRVIADGMEDAPYVQDTDMQGEDRKGIKMINGVHIPEYTLVRSDDPERLAQYEADFDQEYLELKERKKNGNAGGLPNESKGKKVTRREKHMAQWAVDVQALDESLDSKIREQVSSQPADDALSSDDSGDDNHEGDNIGQFAMSDVESEVEVSKPKKSVKTPAPGLSTATSRWFSNPIFADMADDSSDDEERAAPMKELAEADLPVIPTCEKQEKKRKRAEKAAATAAAEKKKFGKKGKDAQAATAELVSTPIEVVPRATSIPQPSSLDEIAEIQALGSLMLRKKSRLAVIEAGFTKNSRDQVEDLPDWFVEEEKRYNQKQLPLTKELMQQYRAKLREINARPIRKEAEALGRRRRRVQKKLDGIRKMTNSLMDNGDEEGGGHSSIHKAKQIVKAMKAAKKDGKRKTVFMAVQRKGGASKQVGGESGRGAKVAMVDRRLKKDRRGQRNAMQRNKGKR